MAFAINCFPENLQIVYRTELITNQTIDCNLLIPHINHNNYYSILIVKEGELQVSWDDSATAITASPDRRINILPNKLHHLTLSEHATFYIEYYSANKNTSNPQVHIQEAFYFINDLRTSYAKEELIELIDENFGINTPYYNRKFKDINSTTLVDLYISQLK